MTSGKFSCCRSGLDSTIARPTRGSRVRASCVPGWGLQGRPAVSQAIELRDLPPEQKVRKLDDDSRQGNERSDQRPRGAALPRRTVRNVTGPFDPVALGERVGQQALRNASS